MHSLCKGTFPLLTARTYSSLPDNCVQWYKWKLFSSKQPSNCTDSAEEGTHMASVPSIFLFIAVSALADIITISIPAGETTTLQDYLCNGALPSSTTLELQRGVHVITHTGPRCIVGANLKNIRITGAGKSETKVICRGRWRFEFNGAQNVTIEGLAFVDCGGPFSVWSIGTGAVSAALYLNLAISVSVNNVAFFNSSGYGVYGLALTDFVMSDVDFGACGRPRTIYGAGAEFIGSGINLTLITIKRCTFVELCQPMTITRGYIYPAGLEVRDHVVDIRDCSFRGNGRALSATASDVSVSNCSFIGNVAISGAAITAINMLFLNVTSSKFDSNTAKDQGGAILIMTTTIIRQVTSRDPVLVVNDCMFQNNIADEGGAVIALQLRSRVELLRTVFFGNKACIGAAVYAGDAHNRYSDEQSYYLDLVDVELIENQCIPCRS